MLDLKAKLAAAGLVTDKEIEDAQKRRPSKSSRPSHGSSKSSTRSNGPRPNKGPKKAPKLDVASVTAQPRGEQYVEVRRVVEATRLDAAGPAPSERARAFHFPKPDGTVGRLFVEAAAADALEGGRAKIVGYMSNHGVAHAVVPTAVADAVVQIFPEWALPTGEPDVPET
jgi:hypothetical protein